MLKARPVTPAGFQNSTCRSLALAGFETALRLVDHVNAAFAAHYAAVAVPVFQRAE